jgi:hypothetical protein
MPVDLPDVNLQVGALAWLCDSYEEAIESVEEFIKSEDFIPEIDARFEIFDDVMEPCADQKMIEGLVIEALEQGEMRSEEVIVFPTEETSTSASTTGTAIIPREEIIITTTSPPKPEAPKKEEKVAQFDEIEIEDKRG